MDTQTNAHPNGSAPPAPADRWALGPKLATAWQAAWDRLDTKEYVEGVALAQAAVEDTGKKVSPDSLLAHMHVMARIGTLEREQRYVAIDMTRGGKTFPAKRKRTFYRIAAGK